MLVELTPKKRKKSLVPPSDDTIKRRADNMSDITEVFLFQRCACGFISSYLVTHKRKRRSIHSHCIAECNKNFLNVNAAKALSSMTVFGFN